MKKLLIILLIAVPFKSLAQDPDLFQTWNIHNILSELIGPIAVFSSDVEPDIIPTMTFVSISDTEIQMTGFSGCNNYTVTYEYLPGSPIDELDPIAFETEGNICSDSIMLWESQLYIILYPNIPFYYNIDTTPDGQKIDFSTAFFDHIHGQNYGLSTGDFEQNRFAVFPNPTQETLSWTASISEAVTVRIYSAQGKLIKSEITALNSIDVSALSSGLYFIELQDEQAISRSKFLKQ